MKKFSPMPESRPILSLNLFSLLNFDLCAAAIQVPVHRERRDKQSLPSQIANNHFFVHLTVLFLSTLYNISPLLFILPKYHPKS